MVSLVWDLTCLVCLLEGRDRVENIFICGEHYSGALDVLSTKGLVTFTAYPLRNCLNFPVLSSPPTDEVRGTGSLPETTEAQRGRS